MIVLSMVDFHGNSKPLLAYRVENLDSTFSWLSDHVSFSCRLREHYANKSMQYTVIFLSCKNDNFQMKKL